MALLCLPLLWQRVPTLQAVAPELVRAAAAALWALPPPQLTAVLNCGAMGSAGQALAATALLGNLLEMAPSLLRVKCCVVA